MPKYIIEFAIESHIEIEAETADEARLKFDNTDVGELMRGGHDDIEIRSIAGKAEPSK